MAQESDTRRSSLLVQRRRRHDAGDDHDGSAEQRYSGSAVAEGKRHRSYSSVENIVVWCAANASDLSDALAARLAESPAL
jgi:hypothetical protein